VTKTFAVEQLVAFILTSLAHLSITFDCRTGFHRRHLPKVTEEHDFGHRR